LKGDGKLSLVLSIDGIRVSFLPMGSSGELTRRWISGFDTLITPPFADSGRELERHAWQEIKHLRSSSD